MREIVWQKNMFSYLTQNLCHICHTISIIFVTKSLSYLLHARYHICHTKHFIIFVTQSLSYLSRNLYHICHTLAISDICRGLSWSSVLVQGCHCWDDNSRLWVTTSNLSELLAGKNPSAFVSLVNPLYLSHNLNHICHTLPEALVIISTGPRVSLLVWQLQIVSHDLKCLLAKIYCHICCAFCHICPK